MFYDPVQQQMARLYDHGIGKSSAQRSAIWRTRQSWCAQGSELNPLGFTPASEIHTIHSDSTGFLVYMVVFKVVILEVYVFIRWSK